MIEVGVFDVLEADHAVDQRHALGGRIGRDAAARGGGFVVLLHHAHAALELLLAGLDQRHRNAGIGERHRDAAAHGAGADDGDALDRARLGAFRHARDLGRLALGEERIALRLGLVAGHQLQEALALLLQTPRRTAGRCAAPTASAAANGASSPRDFLVIAATALVKIERSAFAAASLLSSSRKR